MIQRIILMCLVVAAFAMDTGTQQVTPSETPTITAVRVPSASDITPQWGCWFNSYPAPLTTVVNLLFSYNNSQDYEITVPDSLDNNISPAQFNGYQPFVFKAGLNLYSVQLVDSRNYLQMPTAQIAWSLGGQAVVVDSSMLVVGERCDVKYDGVCPTWVNGFCDDSVYCNGVETCFTTAVYRQLTIPVLGTCQRPLEGVTCSVSEICNETTRSCVVQYVPPPPPTVIPLFNCWYYSAPGVNQTTAMHVNLVFGYNNTGAAPVTRYITLDSGDLVARNNIVPDAYNTVQPVVFRVGYVDEAFTLVDGLNAILNTPITWSLTDRQVTVFAANLTDDRMCEGMSGIGSPTAPSDNSSTAPPTPEAEVPTSGPTSGGDPIPSATQCSIDNTDCSAYDTFCNGPTTCDLSSGYCVLVDPSYTPCQMSVTSVRPGVSMQMKCVEHASVCVAVVVPCFSDSDCNNGLFCDGQEYCTNSTCFFYTNLTITQLCGTPDAICVETVGCRSTSQLDGGIIFGITAGAMAGLGLVLLIIYLVYRSAYMAGSVGAPKDKSL